MPEKSPTRRRFARKMLVAVVALSATLVLAELALRTFAPLHLVGGLSEIYRYDAELGYAPQAGVDRFRVTDFRQEFHTNQLGTVNYQETFDRYDSLVFALGDSYTQGTGLPADASFPFQLDLALNLDADGVYRQRFAVVNLGLAAYGGEQALITLDRFAAAIAVPDVVLFFGSDNDLEDDLLFRSGYRHRHLVAGSPTWGPLVQPLQLLSRLEIVKRGKLAIGRWRRARVTREPAASDSSPATATATASSVSTVASVAERQWPVLDRIRRAAEGYGASFVIGWANPSSGSYDWLARKAAAEQIGFADWRPAAESVSSGIPAVPWNNPHSGGHYRTWVNQVIARAFAAELHGDETAALGSPPSP